MYLFLLHVFIVCACMWGVERGREREREHTCGSQRITFKRWFFPSLMGCRGSTPAITLFPMSPLTSLIFLLASVCIILIIATILMEKLCLSSHALNMQGLPRIQQSCSPEGQSVGFAAANPIPASFFFFRYKFHDPKTSFTSKSVDDS